MICSAATVYVGLLIRSGEAATSAVSLMTEATMPSKEGRAETGTSSVGITSFF